MLLLLLSECSSRYEKQRKKMAVKEERKENFIVKLRSRTRIDFFFRQINVSAACAVHSIVRLKLK